METSTGGLPTGPGNEVKASLQVVRSSRSVPFRLPTALSTHTHSVRMQQNTVSPPPMAAVGSMAPVALTTL